MKHNYVNPLKTLLFKQGKFIDVGNLLVKIVLIVLTSTDVLDLSGEVPLLFTSAEFTVLLKQQSL
jgi:hypothetical protein